MNITCTHCQAQLDVPAALLQENRVISCPQCNKHLVVRVDERQGEPRIAKTAVSAVAPAHTPTPPPAAAEIQPIVLAAPQVTGVLQNSPSLEDVIRSRWGTLAVVTVAVACIVAATAVAGRDEQPQIVEPPEVRREEPIELSPDILTASQNVLMESIRSLRQENGELHERTNEQQSNIKKLEGELQESAQEKEELKKKVVMSDRWQQATFVVHSSSFAAGIRPQEDGQFEIVTTATHPQTEYVAHVARKLGIPRVMGDKRLARRLVDHAKMSNLADVDLATRLGKYWRIHKYVKPDRELDAPFVLFKDLRTDRYRLGFLLGTDEDSLTFRPVARSTETVPRSRIESGTARKGIAARIRPEAETDFLDLAMLRVAQGLESEEGVRGFRSIAIKVQTDALEEALALSKEPDKTANDMFFDFLARIRLEPYRPDARKEPTRILRRFAEYLHDDIGARLNRLSVPVLEREELQAVLNERSLASREEFEPRDYAGMLSASHMLIADVDKAREGGAFRVSIRLVEADTGMKLVEENGDVGRRPPEIPDRFLLVSGRPALLSSTKSSPRPSKGSMAPLLFSASQPESRPARVVMLEHAGGKVDRYRELFGHRLVTPDPKTSKLSRLTIGSLDNVPRNEQLRLVTWHIARAILPASGRINDVDANRVVMSIGSDNGVENGDRFRVLRHKRAATELDDEILRPAAILPVQIRVDHPTAHHSTGYVIESGVDHLWPDSGVRAGDLVLREEAESPRAYVAKLRLDPTLMPKEASIQANMLNGSQMSRLSRTGVHLAERLHDAIQHALDRVGVRCVTEAESATHVIEGDVAPVKGISNDTRFLVQFYVRHRKTREITGAVLPIKLTIDEVDAWRP